LSTRPTQTTPDVEATIAQLRELTDAILDYAKHADAVQLDAVERTLRALADFQGAAAQTHEDQRARSLAAAYAGFTREVTDAYVTAARELRK
jgi:hypothetical protein